MKKIMFSDAFCLTQAVLSGTKTMTRRLDYTKIAIGDVYKIHSVRSISDKGKEIFTLHDKNGEYLGKVMPRYKVGEVVAIAQSYKSIADERDEAEAVLDLYKIGDNLLTMDEMGAGWNNKMCVKSE